MQKVRCSSNNVSSLKDRDGTWLTDQKHILGAFETFYCEVFKKQHSLRVIDNLYLKRILKDEASAWLERPFKEEEVLKTLKMRGRNKALGPHGFTSAFFLDH